MPRTCPYCASAHVRQSGNRLGRAFRRLIGRPRFRCHACMAAWYGGPQGPVRAQIRRSVFRRHPVASLAVALLVAGAVYAALVLLGAAPDLLARARRAKLVTGYSGKKYTVEEAVDRAGEPHSRREEKPGREEDGGREGE